MRQLYFFRPSCPVFSAPLAYQAATLLSAMPFPGPHSLAPTPWSSLSGPPPSPAASQTHTMLGTAGGSSSLPSELAAVAGGRLADGAGVIPRAFDELFNWLEEGAGPEGQALDATVQCSVAEIYMEKVGAWPGAGRRGRQGELGRVGNGAGGKWWRCGRKGPVGGHPGDGEGRGELLQ